MKRKLINIIGALILLSGGLVLTISMSPSKKLNESIKVSPNKPVIFIIIDSLMTEPLQKAMKDGTAPAFSFLINNGHFETEVVSSYPTMSVAIDSTILTGTYANEHKVPGLIWFNDEEQRMISYGSGIREMWHNGIKNVALDSIIRLNEEHLSQEVQTIHEALASQNVQSASINGLLYRGNAEQTLHVPKVISLTNLLPSDIIVKGPTILSLGALSQYNPKNDRHKFAWKRLGVNNDFTVNELNYLIQQNKLPPFTLAYFPDADAQLHKKGPDDLKAIEEADKSIQQALNAYPSWEDAIQQATWIILGDSGQSYVKEEKDTSLIQLDELLDSYSFWTNKEKKGQLAIAINERMAYIYVNDSSISIEEILRTLKKEKRIQLIAWKEDETNYVVSPKSNQSLTFSQNGPMIDQYNQSWTINGDTSILDLTIKNQADVQYNQYPDALARLHGALHAQQGRVIIVDALPSFEFITKYSHDHAGGGAHGSLHKVDSLVPLIVTGTDILPPSNRLVDLKKWILTLVNGS